MAFIGTTRFSIYDPKSLVWKSTSTFNSATEYLNYLYAAERIEPRLRILSKFSIPLIAAAAEKHPIRHLIRYSTEMPEEYIEQLKELSNQYDFIVLEPHSEGRSNLNPYKIGDEISGGSKTYGIYRLDDDDLLTSDFFDQTARYVSPAFAGMKVSLASGVTGLYDGVKFSTFRHCYRPKIAIGLLGIYTTDGNGKFISPPDSPHHIADKFGSVVLNSERPSYFWTRHVGQDTTFDAADKNSEIIRELNTFEPLPPSWNVEELFPTMRGSIKTRGCRQRLDGNTSINSGDFVKVSPVKGHFTLRIDASFDKEVGPNSALIKFKIKNTVNDKLLEPSETTVPGLSISHYPSIGYFLYLKTTEGRTTQEVNINLSGDLAIEEIGIQPFGIRARPIEVHSLEIITDE